MKNKLLSMVQKLSFFLSYLTKNSFSEVKFLKNLNLENKIIVDIGSNVGSFINLILKIEKNANIYSIEPNKDLIKIQKNKFKKNKNIQYFNFAIGEKNSIEKFYYRSPSSHSSLLQSHQDNDFNKIINIGSVKTFTFHQFLKNEEINEIQILKVDIEGLDYKIFSSLKNLILNKKIKFFKIEVNSENFLKIISLSNEMNLKFLGISKSHYFKNKYKFMDIYFENTNF